MCKFIMMVGLPGSGKSTEAKKIALENNAVIISSDSIRKEFFGSEADQTHHEEVFNTMMEMTLEALRADRSVVYDATNLSSKKRIHTLSQLNRLQVEKIAVLMATPYHDCLTRNSNRDRVVPEHAMRRMYMSFNVPCKQEGFDEIRIIFPDNLEYLAPFEIVHPMELISHDNPHHTASIGQHMNNALQYFYDHYASKLPDNKDCDTVLYATYFHDIGKPFTKTFINYKGEEVDIAHYYNHNNVGAYDVLFSSIDDNIKIDVALLIQYHMHYYTSWKESKKAEKRDREFLGERLSKMLDMVHKCDVKAH